MHARRWTGGRYGVGSRIKLRYTRAIIDGIHSGELSAAKTSTTPIFDLHVRQPPLPLAPHCAHLLLVLFVRPSCCLDKLSSFQAGSVHRGAQLIAERCATEACCAQVPVACSGVPDEILNPRNQWSNKGEFDSTLSHLADLYQARAASLFFGTLIGLHHAWARPSMARIPAGMPHSGSPLSDQTRHACPACAMSLGRDCNGRLIPPSGSLCRTTSRSTATARALSPRTLPRASSARAPRARAPTASPDLAAAPCQHPV